LLDGEEYGGVEMLQRERQAKLIVKPDHMLHIEQYDIVTL